MDARHTTAAAGSTDSTTGSACTAAGTADPWTARTLRRLSGSAFRSRFRLGEGEVRYLRKHGRASIAEHAARFIDERIAPAHPDKDGRQTPWAGHPVFVAQHATACCCRGCIEKWHGIPRGHDLTAAERARLLTLIMTWLGDQLGRAGDTE